MEDDLHIVRDDDVLNGVGGDPVFAAQYDYIGPRRMTMRNR